MTRLEKMVIRVGRADLRLLSRLPASFRLAAMILVGLKKGRLDVTFPDGRTFRFEGSEPGPLGEIIVRDPSFAGRVLARGDIGFAEAFMDEQFDTPSLPDVLEYFTRNFESAGKLAVGGWMAQWMNALQHARNRNSRKGSKRNILAHYDLGNEFYGLWLDPSMTYSSALFSGPEQSLEEAQRAKYRAIAAGLKIVPGMRVLEIGSGWGGFAEVAAREFGAKVDSVTISDAQHAYARRRMEAAGLANRVNIQLKDYRDVDGQYDAVASIEMFEAVGEKYWPAYFDKVAQVLRPGGRASLQIITIDDREFDYYRTRVDFIQTYIFPGGMLPSVKRLREESARAGLGFAVGEMYGLSYARTLSEWARRFEAAWETISRMGFDERFRRMWRYYLAYCEAGFRTGRIDVGRFVLSKPD
jgi:cyclopropane-fatty-acyl-phospholipid synthase